MQTEKKHIMIFGGTTEGRLLAEFCDANQIHAYISVTSEYGAGLLPESDYVTVLCDRMNDGQMAHFFVDHVMTHVIDATHPYALEATKNIRQACEKLDIPYLRVVREQEKEVAGVLYFDDMPSLIEYLNQHKGGIFITTGSKEAASFCEIENYESRCVLRVLDVPTIVDDIEQMGYRRERIIAGRGPFLLEENIRHFKSYDVRYLVTKDSGSAGGFTEKLEAAKVCGMECLVLRRQQEQGYTLEHIQDILTEL